MYIHNYNILTSSLCLYTFSKLEIREIASDNFKDGLRVGSLSPVVVLSPWLLTIHPNKPQILRQTQL